MCNSTKKTCERLISNGAKLSEVKDGNLYVVNVVNENEKFLEYANDGEALEYLFGVSKKAGADLTVLRSNDISQTMIDFAKDNNITHMVLGTAANNGSKEPEFALKLQNHLPNVEFIVI